MGILKIIMKLFVTILALLVALTTAQNDLCNVNTLKVEYYTDAACKDFDREDAVYGNSYQALYDGKCHVMGKNVSARITCGDSFLFMAYFDSTKCEGKGMVNTKYDFGKCYSPKGKTSY